MGYYEVKAGGKFVDKLKLVEKLREKTGITYEDAKRVLEINNWDILDAILDLEKQGKVKGEVLELMREPIEQIPLPAVDDKTFTCLETLVEQIMTNKENNLETTELEKEIDELVYKLYDLTPEEIALVKESVK